MSYFKKMCLCSALGSLVSMGACFASQPGKPVIPADVEQKKVVAAKALAVKNAPVKAPAIKAPVAKKAAPKDAEKPKLNTTQKVAREEARLEVQGEVARDDFKEGRKDFKEQAKQPGAVKPATDGEKKELTTAGKVGREEARIEVQAKDAVKDFKDARKDFKAQFRKKKNK